MAIERLPALALDTDERREIVLACDPAVVEAAAAFDDADERLADLMRGEGDNGWAYVDGASRFTIRPLTRREMRIATLAGGEADPAVRLDASIVSTVRAGLVAGWGGEVDDLPLDALTELWGHINRLTTLGKAPAPSSR